VSVFNERHKRWLLNGLPTTVDELKALIDEAVDQRLRELFQLDDSRTLEEVLDSIDRHRWTPPPGTPSTLELLREDRDQ
jgi:hypothetical protein